MKVQVLQESLSKVLSSVSRFTSNRAQLPILANILLSAKNNKMVISATNLENSISTKIGAKVEKEGEITIPSRVISDLISNLSLGPVSLESEKEQLKINNKDFTSNIMGANSSDFPSIPQKLEKEFYSLEKETLNQALSQLLFAVSIDETRPILTGVLFFFGKGGLVLVATDGFRLSRKKISVKLSTNEKKVILPKTILLEVGRLSAESEEISFSLREKDNMVVFNVGESILSSRILQGEFPDYEKIIPSSSAISMLVDREELLKAIKLASVFARDSANMVKLILNKDTLEVFAESSLAGNQKTKVEVKIESSNLSSKENPSLEIAFNYHFLEDFLQALDAEVVRLGFSSADSPGVFTDPNDETLLHLIMPVKI